MCWVKRGVLFHVDDTSDALFEWKTQEHSLGHCLTFLRLLMCLYCLLSPQLSHFTCQRAHSLWKRFIVRAPLFLLTRLLLILCTTSEQYSSLVSITRCLLASSETSGPTRWGSVCELLFVASGCFHSERGHCHCPKVVIYQHLFEATVQIGNNVGYYYDLQQQ